MTTSTTTHPAETANDVASESLKENDHKDVTTESSYWNDFYAKQLNTPMGIPSQFCVMVATEADKNQPIVEYGCGNGRDSIYLARHGFKVYSGDLSEEAITANKQQGGDNGANFNVCDVSKGDQVKSLLNKARGATAKGNLSLYNRFFLHSLDDEQERLFLTAMSEAAIEGDTLYMEFRCSLDAKLDHLFKGHFRRYVETANLVAMLETELGWKVTYERTGQGMAKYKNEDPFVSRLICTRK